jgi:hypothetical protein
VAITPARAKTTATAKITVSILIVFLILSLSPLNGGSLCAVFTAHCSAMLLIVFI